MIEKADVILIGYPSHKEIYSEEPQLKFIHIDSVNAAVGEINLEAKHIVIHGKIDTLAKLTLSSAGTIYPDDQSIKCRSLKIKTDAEFGFFGCEVSEDLEMDIEGAIYSYGKMLVGGETRIKTRGPFSQSVCLGEHDNEFTGKVNIETQSPIRGGVHIRNCNTKLQLSNCKVAENLNISADAGLSLESCTVGHDLKAQYSGDLSLSELNEFGGTAVFEQQG